MSKQRGPMPTVVYEGSVYSLLSRKTEVPDFGKMESLHVRLWLCKHTRGRGYQKPTNPLIGFGSAIKIGL